MKPNRRNLQTHIAYMIGGLAIVAIAILRLGNNITYLPDDPRAQPSYQMGVTAFGVVLGVFLFAYGAIRLVVALRNRRD